MLFSKYRIDIVAYRNWNTDIESLLFRVGTFNRGYSLHT